MLSATAVEETHWPTQFDIPSEENVAFLFSELMRSKAGAIGSLQASNQGEEEALQQELTSLSEQWRHQEVGNRISRLEEACTSGTGIATRLKRLRAAVKEEENPEADISAESLRALQLFLQAAGNIKSPEITLTPEMEVYLRWKSGRDYLFAVHLVSGRIVRYAIFAPNPRHPRFVRRLSGIEAADTVLETAGNVFSGLDWIKDS